MTTRTVTLLMLSLFALVVSAVLHPFVLRLGVDSPLALVGLSALCMTVALFAGRRYLLPHAMAESSRKALAITAIIVLTSMVAAALVSVLVRFALGTTFARVTSVGVLWLVALYFGFSTLHRTHARSKLPQF